MNSSNPPEDEHRRAWELIPWHVNGRLDESERQRIDAHLRQCRECREETEMQRRVCGAMAADGGVEQIPAAGLARLRREIDALPAAGPKSVPGRRIRHIRALAASLAVIVVGGALVTPALQHAVRGGAGSDYFTVTNPSGGVPGAVIRAVFVPTTTVSQLQTLLADAHLKIVAGPTEAGVYSLAMADASSIDGSLQRLRQNPAVRFAEGVAPRSEAPP